MEEKEIDRIERHENDNDEGATWSMSSNGGISRSSHDDGIIFQSKFIFKIILNMLLIEYRSFGVKDWLIEYKYVFFLLDDLERK
jgi:hypothetical protein